MGPYIVEGYIVTTPRSRQDVLLRCCRECYIHGRKLLGARDTLGQNGLYLGDRIAGIHTTGKGIMPTAVAAWAFNQVANLEIKFLCVFHMICHKDVTSNPQLFSVCAFHWRR